MRRIVSSVAVVVLVAACTTIATRPFDDLFGPADPAALRPARSRRLPGQSYAQTIQPILDRRCVVCHACYDAPCQLKTTSWEGLARGASKTPVYDATRLLAADAVAPLRRRRQGRRSGATRDFFPVLNEHAPHARGQSHRRPDAPPAGAQAAASAADRGRRRQAGWTSRSTARRRARPAREIDAYERKRSRTAACPSACPALTRRRARRADALARAGRAVRRPRRAPPPLAQQRVAQWERFFNGDSLKEQLFARYAYEHLFLAHLYFDDDPQRQLLQAGALAHAARASRCG